MFRPEDYVTHDVGFLLKEIGFNEPVHSQYTKTGTSWVCQEPENFNESVDCCCSRPTLYEAQRWICKAHNLHVVIHRNSSGFYWSIVKANYGTFITDYKMEGPNAGGCWDDYEPALNDGIYNSCKLIVSNYDSRRVFGKASNL